MGPGRWTLLTAVALGFGSACVVGACATQADTTPIPPPPEEASAPDTSPVACVSASTIRCGLICTDTKKDPTNCGMCGNNCGLKRFCSSGSCADSCLPPTTQCNNTTGVVCANLISDHENCGKCGTQCAATEDCVPAGNSAICQKHCDPGLTLCGSDCSTLRNDVNHCGDCNTTCDTTSGATCSDGLCCGPGQANCAGACTSTAYDDNNCGSCGFACGGITPYCVGSACQTCNPNVLILNENASSDTTALATSIQTAGATTTSGGKPSAFTGTPTAAKAGAVVILTGFTNMPSSGQTDVADAFGKGVGLVVVDYYFNYYANVLGYWSSIYPLMPETGSSAFGSYTTHTFVDVVAHPVWGSLPSSWSRTGSEYGFPASNKGGTVVATTLEGPSVIVKNASGSNGRVVYVSVAFSENSGWTSDANALKLITNAATWATGCF